MSTPMDPGFAMFNSHVNRAKDRAKRSFIKKFGRKVWDKRLQPFIDAGIMSIFNKKPNRWTEFYVNKVTSFVNEGRNRDKVNRVPKTVRIPAETLKLAQEALEIQHCDRCDIVQAPPELCVVCEKTRQALDALKGAK